MSVHSSEGSKIAFLQIHLHVRISLQLQKEQEAEVLCNIICVSTVST